MVEGNDEWGIEYNMISEELWWDERMMHGSAKMRASGNARGCKELEKVGGAMERCNPTPRRTGTSRSI
jgi:hypothetical protein